MMKFLPDDGRKDYLWDGGNTEDIISRVAAGRHATNRPFFAVLLSYPNYISTLRRLNAKDEEGTFVMHTVAGPVRCICNE